MWFLGSGLLVSVCTCRNLEFWISSANHFSFLLTLNHLICIGYSLIFCLSIGLYDAVEVQSQHDNFMIFQIQQAREIIS